MFSRPALRVFLGIFLFIWFSSSSLAIEKNTKMDGNYRPVDDEMRSYLTALPSGAVTIDTILLRGMATSDSFAKIKAESLSIESSSLRSKALLDPKFQAEIGYLDDQSEAASPFSPNTIRGSNLSLSLSKMWKSGTSIESKIAHGQNKIFFNSFDPIDTVESSLSLNVSQDLWRNRFGKEIKSQLKAGDLASKTKNLQINEATYNWMEQFIDLFYTAWLSQEKVRNAEELVRNKKRLKKITDISLRRGTAEEPDRLQVERAVQLSEIAHLDAKNELENIWRELVYGLKLPDTWAEINPLEVPVLLDDNYVKAEIKCKHETKMIIKTENSSQKLLKAQIETNRADSDAIRESLKPNLKLQLGLASNGIDPSSRPKTLEETFSGENPSFQVGIVYSATLGKSGEKARYLENYSKTKSLEAELEILNSDKKVKWRNSCRSLDIWKLRYQKLAEVFKQQKRRIRLEEKRFRIGRVPLQNVILATDEANESASQTAAAKIQWLRSAWRVLRQSGDLQKYHENLMQRLISKAGPNAMKSEASK